MRKFLLAAGGAAALLAGCAYDPYTPQGTTATTVTRDYWGNPVDSTTVVRDAWGNPVASSRSGGYVAPGSVYAAPPVYSGSSVPPATVVRPETQLERDRRAAQDPNCRATLLHQDRPGGSNYDPRRGAPSC